jgi:hypothetical protein
VELDTGETVSGAVVITGLIVLVGGLGFSSRAWLDKRKQGVSRYAYGIAVPG